MGTNSASVPGTFPALAVPKPLALLAPPVYPILLSPSSAHSCSSLGGRLGGPQDMVPYPGSSPAICHPLAQIKHAGISWPPAEMPTGWEGKLRHEAGRREARQGAGSGGQRRLHVNSFFLIFFALQELPCLSPHPSPPGLPPAGPQPQLFREVPARLFPSLRGAAPVWKPHGEP